MDYKKFLLDRNNAWMLSESLYEEYKSHINTLSNSRLEDVYGSLKDLISPEAYRTIPQMIKAKDDFIFSIFRDKKGHEQYCNDDKYFLIEQILKIDSDLNPKNRIIGLKTFLESVPLTRLEQEYENYLDIFEYRWTKNYGNS